MRALGFEFTDGCVLVEGDLVVPWLWHLPKISENLGSNPSHFTIFCHIASEGLYKTPPE